MKESTEFQREREDMYYCHKFNCRIIHFIYTQNHIQIIIIMNFLYYIVNNMKNIYQYINVCVGDTYTYLFIYLTQTHIYAYTRYIFY